MLVVKILFVLVLLIPFELVLRMFMFEGKLFEVLTLFKLIFPFCFVLSMLLVKGVNGIILVNPTSLLLAIPFLKSLGTLAKKFCLFLSIFVKIYLTQFIIKRVSFRNPFSAFQLILICH